MLADGEEIVAHVRVVVSRQGRINRQRDLAYTSVMPVCKKCGDEVETLVSVKVGNKKQKLCEDCADRIREEGEIAEASEAVVQNMMGFKGRR